MACSCGNDNVVNLLYSCSGSANTGHLADQVWRKLKETDIGSGTCLAAVGADLSGFIESAKVADVNIIIDGCPVGCGKRIFENNSLPYKQFVITDFDVKKGKTEITPEVISRVTTAVQKQIG